MNDQPQLDLHRAPSDSDLATETVRRRLQQVVSFLDESVASSQPTPRTIDATAAAYLHLMPVGLPGCEVIDDETILRCQQVPDPERVTVPDALAPWLHAVSHEPRHEPYLAPGWRRRAADHDEDVEAIERIYQAWTARVWRPWAELTEQARRVTGTYRRIREIGLDLERNTGELELVWGRGLITGEVAGEHVNHPLVLTPVEVVVDPSTGVLDVRASGQPRLEVEALRGLPTEVVGDVQRLVDAGGRLPFDLEDDDLRGQLWRRVLLALRSQPRVLSRDVRAVDPSLSEGLLIHDTGVLFLRRRSTNLRGFLADLRASGAGSPAGALTGVGALSSMLADEPTRLHDRSDPPRDWAATSERLLMPLPSNEDQRKIAGALARRKLVAVQGPPGTGKTHTIANLISHLVAHGKRVLVVAHKEEPLTEVRDKIPVGLRELSIAVMGSSAAQTNQMQAAVRRLQAIGSATDLPEVEAAAAQLGEQLDDLVRRRGVLAARLRATAVRDRSTLEVDGIEKSPLQVGEWLVEQAAHSWLPDPISSSTILPLEAVQLAEVLHLSAALTPTDRQAALAALPRGRDLPDGRTVTRWATDIDGLKTLDAELQELGLKPGASARTPDLLEGLAARVTRLAESLRRRPTWLRALATASVDAGTRESWRSQRAALTDELDQITARREALSGHVVTLDGEMAETPKAHLDGLLALGELYRDGKRPSVLARSLRRVARSSTVDGEQLANSADVDLAVAHLELEQSRRRLARRWADLTGPHGGPTPDPERPEHLVASAMADLSACIDSETVVWPALREALAVVAEVPPGRPEPGPLEALGSLLMCAQELPRLLTLENERAEVISLLRAGAALTAATPHWDRLAQHVAEGDGAAWDDVLEDAERLAGLTDRARRQRDLLAALARQAPVVAVEVDEGQHAATDPAAVMAAWVWRRNAAWLDEVVGPDDSAAVGLALSQLGVDERRLLEHMAATSARAALIRQMSDQHRRALADWAEATGKIGKTGKGARAAFFTQVAQESLQVAQGAVPVWIMSWQRALAQFRGGSTPFDVVIVDEASQCTLQSLPVLTLGKRAVVVGDDKQIGPLEFVPLERALELQRRHLAGVPSKDFYVPSESLFDRASRQPAAT